MSDFPAAERLATNGIHLATYSQGTGDTVVLCHGFPEIAYSWRYQLPALANAGYRAIAPNQRGYADSDQPAAIEDYDILHLVDDLCGLLDTLQLEQALFVGHDWGAMLLWQMALLRPERMRGLVALNIPFIPRRAIDPIVMAREVLGDDFYIVNFQDSDQADRAFDADPERFLAAMYRRLPATRAAFDQTPAAQKQAFSMLREMRKTTLPGTPLLDDADFAVFVDAFRRSGFSAPIHWYRNWTRNWQLTEGVAQQVTIPTLFIGANDDVLIAPAHIETMKRYVNDLTIEIIDQCGHWTQQEHPQRVNDIMLNWLTTRFAPGTEGR